MDVLLTVLGFVITLSVLVFIHEMGHFLAAKMFGVQVDVFSLGFVGSIASFDWKGTRYQIGWVPLGGYVRMLGQFNERIPPTLQKRSFSHKPLWQRAIIVLAGPVANLTFLPILVFFGMYLTWSQEISTTIGTLVPNRPAALVGLMPGDKIIEVDGRKTRYFRDLVNTIGRSPDKKIVIKIKRGVKTMTFRVTPQSVERRDLFGDKIKHGLIGISPDYLMTEIGISDPKSPAGNAGLQTWDRIVKVDGKPVQRWDQLLRYWKKKPAGPHQYTVQRSLRLRSTLLDFRTDSHNFKITVKPVSRTVNGKKIWYHGIHSSEMFIRGTRKGTPFGKVGLQQGDRLVKLNNKRLHLQADLEMFPPSKNLRYSLTFERNGKLITRTLQLFPVNWTTPLNRTYRRFELGVQFYRRPYAEVALTPIKSRVRYAWKRALFETWQMSGQMVGIFRKLFSGELGTKELGSPLMIFQITRESVKRGWESFVRQLAFISINLGMVNLLPIPLLDGGHLLFFLVEAIIRRPVPQRIRESALLLGLMMLVVLMFIALRNDIVSLLAP